LPGCVVGGVALGVVQNLIGLYVGSRAISLAPFLVIMIVLLVRPQGLFAGIARAKKV
jgi:branched-chain amino acid transport system permease protein